MDPGFHPEQDRPLGLEAAFGHSILALAGLSALERFEADRQCGCSPKEAMTQVLRSFPNESIDTAEERIALAVELIGRDWVGPGEAVESLGVFGIHANSLLGSRVEDEASLQAMEVKPLLGLSPDAEGEVCLIRPAGGFSLRGFQELKQIPPGLKVPYLHLESLPQLRGIGEGLSVFRGLRIEGCQALQDLPALAYRGLSIRIADCPAFSTFKGEILASTLHLKNLPALAEISLAPECVSASIIIRECAGLRRIAVSGGEVMDLDLFRSGITELCNLHRVNDYVHIEECRELSKLEGPLTIGGSMGLGCLPQLRRLGRNIKIAGHLHLQAMPDRFELPEDLRIGGKVHLHEPCGDVRIPEALSSRVVIE